MVSVRILSSDARMAWPTDRPVRLRACSVSVRFLERIACIAQRLSTVVQRPIRFQSRRPSVWQQPSSVRGSKHPSPVPVGAVCRAGLGRRLPDDTSTRSPASRSCAATPSTYVATAALTGTSRHCTGASHRGKAPAGRGRVAGAMGRARVGQGRVVSVLRCLRTGLAQPGLFPAVLAPGGTLRRPTAPHTCTTPLSHSHPPA